jgi:hypothetical protein
MGRPRKYAPLADEEEDERAAERRRCHLELARLCLENDTLRRVLAAAAMILLRLSKWTLASGSPSSVRPRLKRTVATVPLPRLSMTPRNESSTVILPVFFQHKIKLCDMRYAHTGLISWKWGA